VPDTIFALASGRGTAGVAVIRVSGERALAVGRALSGALPEPRRASVRTLSRNGEVLDQALAIVFEQRASFTGEDVVEFHVHGSVAVVAAVMAAIGEHEGCRLAEPGEFTRRAFENGRIDLTEVEGLADLIAAETEAQRKQAMRLFSGGLREKADGWRRQLIEAAALLAVAIDFSDEDVPDDTVNTARERVVTVRSELLEEAKGYRWAERVREGFTVVILGAPNTGKSTLLNRLAQREAAITSDIAGTTRDVIAVHMDIGGLPVTVLDTAGLRETDEPVEREGVRRALAHAADADVRIILTEDGNFPEQVQRRDDDIVLRAKIDESEGLGPGISGLTGAGVSELLDEIERHLLKQAAPGQAVVRQRHKAGIDRAIVLLEAVQSAIDRCEPVEIAADQLNEATLVLGALVGIVGVEDILDVVFGSFCIGK